MIRKSKKGISIIVGYVLLVVIALSLSLLVYAWLKGYLPGEKEECPEGVSLIIEDYSCNEKKINLTFQNRGLFYVEGFIVRVSNKSGGLLYDLEKEGYTEHFFMAGGKREPLKPNEEVSESFSYAKYEKLEKIQIQPFILEKQVILCDNAIIEQSLEGCD